MFKEIIGYYQSSRLRALLIDSSLVCFILATLALVRFLFVIADEAHRFRIDFDTQVGSLTTAFQTGTSQLSSNLNDLNVSSKVITSRIDDQITSVKALLHNTAKQSEKASRQELATTRNAIRDSIDTTKEAIQTVADQTGSSSKPVQVNVQPPPAERAEEKIPIVTVQIPEKQKPQPHKRSVWGKVWHSLLRLKD